MRFTDNHPAKFEAIVAGRTLCLRVCEDPGRMIRVLPLECADANDLIAVL